ncbi:hypothetical protein KZ813_05885 [Sphingomonas sp. RHCKR7]|uniref:hypothetical protein n=1 Tax=Sphingomonas folli TaxID=2862497 RepID=UPI001CA4A13D|nr:hypothetical protein [Sphingomonas folli]MBW6526364.1 hypothetical protein [Sphingomonas folli]
MTDDRASRAEGITVGAIGAEGSSSSERGRSVSTIWDEHAVASMMGVDGYRVIVDEGRLDRVVDRILRERLSPRDIRVSLPNCQRRPSSFCDGELAELVRRRRMSLAERDRAG